jgi:hypothetical protein
MKNYQFLAQECKNLKSNNNKIQKGEFQERLLTAMKSFPHGSGFDGESSVNTDLSTHDKIVIGFDFHPMNEDGYYEEWLRLRLIVSSTLLQYAFDIKLQQRTTTRWITRKDGLADYLLDTINFWLEEEVNKETRELIQEQIASHSGN